jgi:hypothetical protein
MCQTRMVYERNLMNPEKVKKTGNSNMVSSPDRFIKERNDLKCSLCIWSEISVEYCHNNPARKVKKQSLKSENKVNLLIADSQKEDLCYNNRSEESDKESIVSKENVRVLGVTELGMHVREHFNSICVSTWTATINNS